MKGRKKYTPQGMTPDELIAKAEVAAQSSATTTLIWRAILYVLLAIAKMMQDDRLAPQ